MKCTSKARTLIALLASAALAPLSYADNLIVAVSPNGEPAAKKAEMIDVIQMMTKTVQPGEEATLMDGLTGRSICTFTVPDRRSYASEKAKLNVNRSCVGKLIRFAEAANMSATAGQLDLPRLLRTIAQTARMNTIDAVVIFGDPNYANPQEPSFAMTGGYVPSDGHSTADRTASPFGMAGLDDSFMGTSVHFTSDGYPWARNTRHEDMVHRFTWLTLATLGAPLATFNADRDQLIKRVIDGVGRSPVSFEWAASDKLEMIYVDLDRGPGLPIHERELSTAVLSAAEVRRAREVEVGISWSCACDLDIWVRPHDNAEVLFYGHTRSREGRFYRDYRNGRDLLNGLESVSFDAPVDLSKMVIGVNFYSGSAPDGVTGEVRLSVGDRTYAKPFVLEATSGNAGNGASEVFAAQSVPNEQWAVFKGNQIVR